MPNGMEKRVGVRPAYAEWVPVRKNTLVLVRGHQSETWKLRHFRQ